MKMDLSTIQSQSLGSDIHGLVERVAFIISQEKNRNDSVENWNLAQLMVVFASFQYKDIFETPGIYHEKLKQRAEVMNIGLMEGNWYAAQDYFAKLVINAKPEIKLRVV